MRYAKHHGVWCARCDQTINLGDPIAIRKGLWVHAHCAAGGDDQ